MTTAATITHWRDAYARDVGAPTSVFTNFGDDIALAMKQLIEKGRTPKAAYEIVTNGLYAEERAVAANRGRRRKRTSRRNKRTSRRSRKRSSR